MTIFYPSMLKIYSECPRKYFYNFVEKFNMPQSNAPFEKGKKIHALANFFIKGADILKLEKSLSESELNAWMYLKNSEYFKMKFLESEYQISAKIEEYWIGGRLDALVEDKNNYYILDYKTGSIPKNPIYDFQTMIYLYCIDKKIKEYNTLNFIYIDLKNFTDYKITLNEQLKKEYVEKLTNTINQINSDNIYIPKKLQNIKCNCNNLKICVER